MEEARKKRRAVTALGMVLAGMLLAWDRWAYGLDPALEVSQYAHTAWKIREGFSKGRITSIAQTPDGYLWLGTEFGLLRFDGVRNVLWDQVAGEHLPSPYVRNLLTAHDGRLWIGTYKGLASLKDGKLTEYRELAGQTVDALLEDREGTIWAGGYVGSIGRLCAIQSGSAQCYGGDGRLGLWVASLYEDRRGDLWVGAQTGLWRWKPGPPRLYATQYPVIGTSSQIMNESSDGSLLLATQDGVKKLVGEKVEDYPLPGTVPRFQAARLLWDRNGGLWIGTPDRGLLHVHQGRTDRFTQSDGLSGDYINKLFQDREGNIWVATLNGLDRFRDFAVPTISVKQGLSNAVVWSVLGARDGSVWLGTPDGLNRWNNGQITIYRREGAPAGGRTKQEGEFNVREVADAGLPNDGVESLFQDKDGRIWAFTESGAAYFENGRFIPVRTNPTPVDSGRPRQRRVTSVFGLVAPGGHVHSITGDSSGNLWISDQHQGLFHLLGKSVVESIPWARLGRKDWATALFAGPEPGGLWLGFSQGGVAYFKDGKVRESYAGVDGLSKGVVSSLSLDSDGALWAATDGGLSRIKNGRVATLTSQNGLPCDTVFWMMQDDLHSFWLYTTCGLVRIAGTEMDAWVADPKRTVHNTLFDSSDGVRSRALTTGYAPLVAKTGNGKLWFLPLDGVSVVDPRYLPLNKLPPPVHIEEVTADRKTYWQNLSGDASSSNPRLPPLVRDLTIDYTALSFVAPEKVRFRYKLEGQDPDWKEVVNDRGAHYSNLAPGNYRFRVTACNNGGVWNETGAFLDFSIAPAYYQTTWFRLSCLAAFVALLSGIYRLRVRGIHQRSEQLALMNAKLEEQVAQRKRTEETLQRSESYLEEAQRLSRTGSWAGSPVEIKYWSDECFRVLGFDPGKGLPSAESFFERIHSEDRARTVERLEKARLEKREFGFDYRVVHPSGEIREIHTVGHPVFSPSGDLVEFVGTVIDVTERKRAEEGRERLRQALAELGHVSRITTLGELSVSLAHEVKQPIAAAITDAKTCLRWLSGDPPDLEEARAAASRMVQDGKRANEIVNRTRLLFQKDTVQRELIDVNDIIREMMLLLYSEATQFAVSIRTELAPDIPQVMGDRVQLQQVLMNLMINSIEAMKDVTGTRELTIQSQRAEDGLVLISVSDTGVGLPPEKAEQIFDAFFTTKPHGTGMGLRISRSIIESYGGRLWAADNSPRGAKFSFTLSSSH